MASKGWVNIVYFIYFTENVLYTRYYNESKNIQTYIVQYQDGTPACILHLLKTSLHAMPAYKQEMRWYQVIILQDKHVYGQI